ncbi:unnamed protein product [Microthlaspi erraticum]|uniref:Aspartic peptidase DDI1-type domain-containing protein n=1 Tax=Microthlaspi erraticum TaxID=1685480 RepID=A0A6D2J1C8_9BRAS|nr:unnamed protein product [Microthlaspi erraticum]
MANIDKVSEVLEMSTHQINLLTSPTFLPKVKDQGKFTLPCTLGHIELDNALVDSGASINLISLTMAEKLGIAGALQRPTTSIILEVRLLCHIESTPPSFKAPEVAKVVKEKVDKEPRVVRDKVEKDKVEKDQRVDKGPRIEKPRLERLRVERPRSDKPRADRRLFKHLLSLMRKASKLCLMSH